MQQNPNQQQVPRPNPRGKGMQQNSWQQNMAGQGGMQQHVGQQNFGMQQGGLHQSGPSGGQPGMPQMGVGQNGMGYQPQSLGQMQAGLNQHGLLGVGQQNFQQPGMGGHGLLGVGQMGQGQQEQPTVIPQAPGQPPAFVGSPGFRGLGGKGNRARMPGVPFGKTVGQFPGMVQPTVGGPFGGMNAGLLGQQGLAQQVQQLQPGQPGYGMFRPPAGGQPPPPPPPPQAASGYQPPPPSMPQTPAAPMKVPQPAPEVAKEGESVAAAADFGARLDALQKQHPSITAPPEVWVWSLTDLETFFSSGGSVRPKPVERKSLTPRKREVSGDLQYEVSDALLIQGQLRECLAETVFQDALKRLHQRYPERKTKGHPDLTAFFEAFEALALSIYARVLPSWGLTADWDGVREMFVLMCDALKHPKVKKTQEEINVLMGLPRNATFTPPAKGEELFVYRPDGDGPVPGYSRPLLEDDDGDEGHEFLIEDRETGALVAQGSGADAQGCSEIWYQVCSSIKAVVIREKPDDASKMVGRKKTGKKIRVQRVVAGKWLELHHSELARLGVQEAWVLLDGSEVGMPGQQLLEKVSSP